MVKVAAGNFRGLTSVIIPVLNEAENIETCIAAARRDYAPDEVEIVVVDGSSSDGTPDLVPSAVTLIRSPRGRAVQMNRGVAASRGEMLVFCHADSQLPAGWREPLIEALSRPGVSGGTFQTLILPEAAWILRLRNRMPQLANWRGMHGDQAQFMTRATFERIGGFPELPLMEDVAMSRTLHREGKLVRLSLRVITSSRRYLEHGSLRQALLNRWNLFRYLYLSATADEIVRTYHSSREEAQ
ncbi:MAG: TIGR04283 family arsenosugar biosynthesis glycosyltransferase [Anaerolineae bacterium]